MSQASPPSPPSPAGAATPFPTFQRWRHSRRRRDRAQRLRLRRVIVGLLLGIAVTVGLTAVSEAAMQVEGQPTVVLSRDLAAGTVISAADVRVEPRPAIHRPSGSLSSPAGVIGQVAAADLPARTIVVAGSLRPAVAPLPRGTVMVAVPLVLGRAPAAGSRVDVFAAGSGERVAVRVLVLAPPATTADSSVRAAPASALHPLSAGPASSGEDPVVWLALTPDQASKVLAALTSMGGPSGVHLGLYRD